MLTLSHHKLHNLLSNAGEIYTLMVAGHSTALLSPFSIQPLKMSFTKLSPSNMVRQHQQCAPSIHWQTGPSFATIHIFNCHTTTSVVSSHAPRFPQLINRLEAA